VLGQLLTGRKLSGTRGVEGDVPERFFRESTASGCGQSAGSLKKRLEYRHAHRGGGKNMRTGNWGGGRRSAKMSRGCWQNRPSNIRAVTAFIINMLSTCHSTQKGKGRVRDRGADLLTSSPRRKRTKPGGILPNKEALLTLTRLKAEKAIEEAGGKWKSPTRCSCFRGKKNWEKKARSAL